MTLYTPENKHHLDENNISLGWQKESISEVGLEPSIWPQRVVGLGL